MKSYDVVGITKDGGVYCPECGPEENDGVIFAGDEWDHKPICDVCGEEIDVTLIEEENNESTE